MKIQRIMSENVETIAPDVSISDAASLMSSKLIGCLIVVEGDDVVGILTERDVLSKITAEGREAKKVKVREVMTSPVISAYPDLEIEEAIKTMGDKKIRRLPVVKDGKLAGVITSTDIIFGLRSELISFAEELSTAGAGVKMIPRVVVRWITFIIFGLFGLGVFLVTSTFFMALLPAYGLLLGLIGGAVAYMVYLYFFSEWFSKRAIAR